MTEALPPAQQGEEDQTTILTGALASTMVQSTRVHVNLGQDAMVVTEDKVRLSLIKHLSRMETKRAWIAPAGICLTIALTLTTAQFQNFIVSAETWRAAFVIAFILSAAWLIRTLAVALRSPSVDDVIEELKQNSATITTQSIDVLSRRD